MPPAPELAQRPVDHALAHLPLENRTAFPDPDFQFEPRSGLSPAATTRRSWRGPVTIGRAVLGQHRRGVG